MHSSTKPLRAGTLLLFWRVHKYVSLFSLFVRVELLCVVVSFADLTKQQRKIVGGFLRSEKWIFLFFYLFSASFPCLVLLFHWRTRDKRGYGKLVSLYRYTGSTDSLQRSTGPYTGLQVYRESTESLQLPYLRFEKRGRNTAKKQ